MANSGSGRPRAWSTILDGRIVFDPDEQVQQAIRLVFDLFEQSASALAVVQHFADHHLQCPTRLWGVAATVN